MPEYIIPADLNEVQKDGSACVACDGRDGPMIPVGRVDGTQVFAHDGCAFGISTAARPLA
ncbi:hypothetical protein [Kitasatospora aureofaciens]|uniref:hypothetical protein n=1 Tax=Kitasatospora aureofaciens TaxID=1894 RepID=UPI0033CD87A0